MGPERPRLTGPGTGLLPRILAGVVGSAALVLAFVVGLFAWVLLAGVALIGGVALSIWFWRTRRQFEKFARQQGNTDFQDRNPDFIDVEYDVVEEKDPGSKN